MVSFLFVCLDFLFCLFVGLGIFFLCVCVFVSLVLFCFVFL